MSSNPWLTHVANYRLSNPGLSYKQALVYARDSYHRQQYGGSSVVEIGVLADMTDVNYSLTYIKFMLHISQEDINNITVLDIISPLVFSIIDADNNLYNITETGHNEYRFTNINAPVDHPFRRNNGVMNVIVRKENGRYVMRRA